MSGMTHLTSSSLLLHNVSLILLLLSVSLDFVVDISKSVVDVDNQLIKEGTVLGEDAAVECLNVVS